MATETSILLARDKSGQFIVPASIGQQVYTITSGIAGGLAGFVLASRLTNATHVKATPLMIASAISAAATFAVVFMISEAE
jgi:hypothetical protein